MSKISASKSFIRDLADIIKENNLTEIEVEDQGTRIRVCREKEQVIASAPAPMPMAAPAPTASAAAPAAAAAAPSADPASHPGAITSPMVGTAYLSPEPGTPKFVNVGDKVNEGDTVLIIEAMKTFNHIAATKSGTVKEILVGDNDPVEFGQALLIVE